MLLAGPGAASGAAEEADEEPICVGDSCQPLPPEPEDPTPGTLVPNPGNPPLHIFEPKNEEEAPTRVTERQREGTASTGGREVTLR